MTALTSVNANNTMAAKKKAKKVAKKAKKASKKKRAQSPQCI